MKAYKLMRRRKNGSLGSLFINMNKVIPLNEWMDAENHPTKGFAKRPGWHCTFKPFAPHLSTKNREWVEVEVEDYRVLERPKAQGGMWILANQMKVISV